MPIRFRCAYCNQLMGIATRKAGAVVTCPKCAGQVVVPPLDPAQQQEAEPNVMLEEDEEVQRLLEYAEESAKPPPGSRRGSTGPAAQPMPAAYPVPPVMPPRGPRPATGPTPSYGAGHQVDVEPLDYGSPPMEPMRGVHLTPGILSMVLALIGFLFALLFLLGFLVGRSTVE